MVSVLRCVYDDDSSGKVISVKMFTV